MTSRTMAVNDPTLLHRYHADPDKPPVALWDHWRDDQGRSTYEVLAHEAGASPRSMRVMDLACGEGYLLALLADMGFTDLVGVDLSVEEIERARARLGGRATLLCEDAGALSLPAASVDVVTCH